MQRSYAPPERWDQRRIILDSEESHHLMRVRRAVIGEEITVFDGEGHEARVKISGVVDGEAELSILEVIPSAIPVSEITLVQAISKPRSMDMVIEKATELGAQMIVPVIAARSIPRMDEDGQMKRHERWLRITRSAGKQCGIDRLPTIAPVTTLTAALAKCVDTDMLLIATLGSDCIPLKSALDRFRRASRICVLIGPEGDWDESEVAAAVAAGGTKVSLGPRVLRVETAAIYVLSVLGYETAAQV
jgi:16S rRNA (uracil1498-N3)-methyltransferase